jgi:hypothetical protein
MERVMGNCIGKNDECQLKLYLPIYSCPLFWTSVYFISKNSCLMKRRCHEPGCFFSPVSALHFELRDAP